MKAPNYILALILLASCSHRGLHTVAVKYEMGLVGKKIEPIKQATKYKVKPLYPQFDSGNGSVHLRPIMPKENVPFGKLFKHYKKAYIDSTQKDSTVNNDASTGLTIAGGLLTGIGGGIMVYGVVYMNNAGTDCLSFIDFLFGLAIAAVGGTIAFVGIILLGVGLGLRHSFRKKKAEPKVPTQKV